MGATSTTSTEATATTEVDTVTRIRTIAAEASTGVADINWLSHNSSSSSSEAYFFWRWGKGVALLSHNVKIQTRSLGKAGMNRLSFTWIVFVLSWPVEACYPHLCPVPLWKRTCRPNLFKFPCANLVVDGQYYKLVFLYVWFQSSSCTFSFFHSFLLNRGEDLCMKYRFSFCIFMGPQHNSVYSLVC